jgi:hypothetical protein
MLAKLKGSFKQNPTLNFAILKNKDKTLIIYNNENFDFYRVVTKIK